MRSVLTSFLIGGLTVSLSVHAGGAQELYQRVVIDSTGQARIVTTSGRAIVLPKDSDQVGFDQVAISIDHRHVGWLALYPNCCTTYPIPLRLVIRTAGKDRIFDGKGLAIWQWTFLDAATRVAYRQAPVHGSVPQHFELHDLGTARLLSVFDMLADSTRLPRWAQSVSDPNDRKHQ